MSTPSPCCHNSRGLCTLSKTWHHPRQEANRFQYPDLCLPHWLDSFSLNILSLFQHSRNRGKNISENKQGSVKMRGAINLNKFIIKVSARVRLWAFYSSPFGINTFFFRILCLHISMSCIYTRVALVVWRSVPIRGEWPLLEGSQG